MTWLSLPPVRRVASIAPLAVRVIVGLIMVANGWQKLSGGPYGFGEALNQLAGVPFPLLTGWVATVVELGGGTLILVGVLSRITALALIIYLIVGILLVNVHVGFLSPQSGGSGVEFPLAVIAGFIVVLLAGPGPVSIDGWLGWDDGWLNRSGEGCDSRMP